MPNNMQNKMQNISEEEIDDVLSEIEAFMNHNGGHMKIDFNGAANAKEAVKEIKVTNSLECAGKNMACQVPTLHEGLDRPENEN